MQLGGETTEDDSRRHEKLSSGWSNVRFGRDFSLVPFLQVLFFVLSPLRFAILFLCNFGVIRTQPPTAIIEIWWVFLWLRSSAIFSFASLGALNVIAL